MNKMNVNTLVEQLNGAEMRTINGGSDLIRYVIKRLVKRLIGLPIQPKY